MEKKVNLKKKIYFWEKILERDPCLGFLSKTCFFEKLIKRTLFDAVSHADSEYVIIFV
jgi:hypothetical protein